jgi:hypothetical protein
MTGVEKMPLPNFIKFGVNLATVKSVKNFYGVPKCDFATIGVFTIYEVVYLPPKGSTFMFAADIFAFTARELHPAIQTKSLAKKGISCRKVVNQYISRINWNDAHLDYLPCSVRERRFIALCPILNMFMCVFTLPLNIY